MKSSRVRFPAAGVFILLVFIGLLHAEPVGPETAAKVTETQIEIINQRLAKADYLGASYTLSIKTIKPLYAEDKEELLAYVFELEPQGFIVVTTNTDLVPVIAYSNRSSFPWDEDPLNLLPHMLREDLSLRIAAREILEPERIARYHREWEGFISGEAALKAPGDSWPPDGQTWTGGWVESMWHQSSPYWNECPIDPVTSDRCVVGCVATAMGQIINFWQYPDAVIFTHADDYVTNTRHISIDATEASIPAIDYNDGAPSFAVCADISYACGVSVEMDYTSQGSGASHTDCANAYRSNFDFDRAQWKEEGSLGFYDILEQNMKDSMPAQLGITDAGWNYAHSIICDGFRETTGDDEWHLNFGWGGSNPDPLPSSWYALPAGMPAGFSVVFDGIVNIEAPRRPGPAAPEADFTADPRSGPAPLTVSFTDLSTGNPTSWSWDFGDTRTSTTRNPTHVYDNEGQYTVSLTVSNANGEDTEVKTGYITVGGAAPSADFAADPRSGPPSLSVAFTDLSTGDPTSWSWDFGDTKTSTIQNPTHVYANEGTYTVSLTAANAYGSDTETKPGYITVISAPQPPDANFSADPTSGPAPLDVAFTDLSTENPTSWSWSFGDGGSSADQNPQHTYNAAGTYTVRLIATNADGSDTETKADYITVTEALQAAFTANPSIGYVPLTHRMEVTFTDQSAGDPTSWSWDFGDNGTSTEQNPTHVYTSAGEFTVRLTVSNAEGDSDDTTGTVQLVVLPGEFFTQVASFATLARSKIEIRYGTPVSTNIELLIYNVNGQLVRRLLSGEVPAGEYEALWDFRDERGLLVGPGVYFLRLKAPEGHAASKIIITR